MAIHIDYEAIKEENLRKYGTDIGRIGDMLLANRYDDRTHFIFEILQNAEDALKKRGEWEDSRTVEFSVSSNALKISHFGKPFDEADVRGICGIGESTKELTDIGRFGIRFKSVYAFTDRPEIHSGQEHFAVESYVWPVAVDERTQRPEETTIYVPFLDEDGIQDDIIVGLQRLGPQTLLFLREIEEISWMSDDGSWGRYTRGMAESIGRNARKLTLLGEDYEGHNVEEEWIVFHRKVYHKRKSAGWVEVAFALEPNVKVEGKPSIKQLNNPPIVVFFPTIVQTHMGFMVQGPYRTTPSRDNIPEDDPWNKYLVRETAELLVGALRKLKNLGLLDISTIECLPLDSPVDHNGIIRNSSAYRFAPLFDVVKRLFMTEPFIPAYRDGYIAGEMSKLARPQALCDLLSDEQLTELYQSDKTLGWLSEEITQDRTPEVHRYLTSELDVDEVTPESFVRQLSLSFLADQTDEWIQQLYEFLNGQRALLRRLKEIPLLRMEDVSHAEAFVDEKPNAYLPGDAPTEFPTVKQSVCRSEGALEFLKALGLREPDPVDDVIENLLPKYTSDCVEVQDPEYQDDIKRILNAFDTDSTLQRDRLVSALRESRFLAVVDAGSGEIQFVVPSDAYMATERLSDLFEGVPGVLLVDKYKECLTGERIRDLLRAVNAPEYLLPITEMPSLTDKEKTELRTNAGWGRWDINPYRGETVKDYALRGIDSLLGLLVGLPRDQASDRAGILWDALCDVRSRRGDAAFRGEYSWFYRTDRHAYFPASFIKTLNQTAWVPDKNGTLRIPGDVSFKDTGWKEDPYLLSIIKFRPAVIDELAVKAGFEPGILDVLKERGITTEAQLIDLLGIDEDSDDHGLSSNGEVSNVISTQSDGGSGSKNSSANGAPRAEAEPKGTNSNGRAADSVGEDQNATDSPTDGTDKNKAGSRREFVSYIAVNPEEPSEELEGLSHEERISLEQKAIDLIIAEEPALRTTKTNNPGFDLMEVGDGGEIVRYVEVKAMSGTLQDRPATLTKRQFEFAQQEKHSYWLYIVENAGDPQIAKIVKINDPSGWATTFTFDHGWKEVSQNAKSG